MGNSVSSSDSEDEREIKTMEESSSENEDIREKDNGALTDVDALFKHAELRSIAAKIKEDIPENVIQQNRHHLIRWLDDREAKGEEVVTLAQFCDMLMTLKPGVPREEAIKAFQQFDIDGSGVVEISSILSAIRYSNGPNMIGELGKSIRMLQACSLTPGFVDVYSEDKNAVSQHAERLLKYLIRNRAPSHSLPFPYLNGFNNTSSMRLSVLKNTFNQLKDAAQSDLSDASLSDGEEVKLLNPCYSTLEVSSNASDAYRLTNGVTHTFWQSDGAARSHWIRLHMRSHVVIKNLSVSVLASDSSYMPEHITVSAGRSIRSLREIKEVRIASNVNGDVSLLKNAKCHYPLIQINIRRCRNDGCDTRIHGLKAVGFKVVKECGVSVSDSAAVWFLQVLASTVTASIPMAPILQKNIVQHSRKALEHIPPLSLCPASPDKPAFLTKMVLQEVEKFVTDVAVQDREMLVDGIQLLLGFNLARGSIGGLLRTLKILQEHPDLNLPCTQLMAKMQKSRDSCWEKTGHQLQLTLSGCDGGTTEENAKPENVLNTAWNETSPAFVSEEGKTKVNMFFKSSEMIQITKLKLKVSAGVKGPKRGLVFVYREEGDFNLEKHVERFAAYDSWGKMEYQFSVQVRNAGIAGKPDNPVAYFTLDDDCDEADIAVHWHPVGQYVLVKFLEPRQESAGKISVVGIKFLGFVRKSVLVDDTVVVKHPPNPDKKQQCSSLEIIQFVMSFLIDLSQDLSQRRSVTGRPEYLEVADIPLDTLCALYHAFRNRGEEKWQNCSLNTLQLIVCLLPTFTSLTGESKTSAEVLFQHLCKTVDDKSVDKTCKRYRLCRQLIIDGAAVFFSDKEARKKQLFSMMHKVETLSETPSVMLVFQSLCLFFSCVDPRGLLDLPKNPADSYDATSVLEVMETMVMVTFHEFSLIIQQTTSTTDQLLPLLQLVSSLQTSLLAWCWVQITEGTEVVKVKAMHTASTYSTLVAQKASESCRLLQNRSTEDLKGLIPKLESSFLGSIVRQMILVITYLCSHLSSASRIKLLNNLQPLNQELIKLATLLPDIFPTINSQHWQGVHTEDIVLRTWEVESIHNYENNVHHTQVFSCPGATKFIVEFDPRCETERRYDYLVFTDAKGLQMRFDQKVGTQKWPKSIQFIGPHIHFLFHTDSSNTEWGYKFKVVARGSPDMPLSWPFDLQLGLIKLMGKLCGATLNANPVLPRDQLMELEEAAEQDILRSDLWTTLFRGGYMIGKLQRSLSGRYESEDRTLVLEFLWAIINNEEKTTDFLQRCKEQSRVLAMGGENVVNAVLAVFCALVWHTQQLRDDLEKYVLCGGEGPVSDGLCQAYNAAESLRSHLVQQRQKVATETDGAELTGDNDPATVCKKKGLYLLKFAGLTKTQLKHELSKSRMSKQMKKMSRRGDRFGKFDVSEKFPSFRLVLEFVQDQAWSTDKVHNMLQERSQHAQAVAEVYMISTDLVTCLSNENPFQILIVLFLQEMLSYQDGFARHYAEGMDGCGLQQEAKVRQSFYKLILSLTGAFHKHKRHQLDTGLHSAYDFVQGALLHLLDIQWQPYDLCFISQVKLPALFSAVAKETVKMRDCRMEKLDEADEVKEYNQHMNWFEECSTGSFLTWYKTKEDLTDTEKKAVQMFIARFCDLLEVEVTCDGCNVTLPGRRYRCLQCIDMDLCATCYSGGVEPEKHTDEHDIIHLVYKCNKCQAFIVGTRIHCNECEDFDLCYGCHLKGSLPSGHKANHCMSRFNQVKLKTSQETDSLIQAYIHQHVWMLFTLLSISMGDIIYNTESGPGLDIDYSSLATHLQNQCISITTHCLQQVPDDEEESFKRPLQMSIEEAKKKKNELNTSPSADKDITDKEAADKQLGADKEAAKKHNADKHNADKLNADKQSADKDISSATTEGEKTDKPIEDLPEGELATPVTQKNKETPAADDKNTASGEPKKADVTSSDKNTDSTVKDADKPTSATTTTVSFHENRSIECRQEEAFSIHSQERIMGLLGAMIPHDTNAALGGSSFNFMTSDFLKLLFKIARGESGHEVNTRHLAMGLLGLLLTRCPVKVADESVTDGAIQADMAGSRTIKYLFSFGSSCLEKNGLEWSCSVARILQRLYLSHDWKLVLHHLLTDSVQKIAKKPELSSIFAMFVMAGFPEVLTTGTLVSYNHTGMEVKSGVVLKHYPDKHTTLLIDVKSRKRHTVQDKYIDCVTMLTEVVDTTNIVVFVDIVKNMVEKKNTDGVDNVENLWVLSLALKLLHNSLQMADNCTIEELYAPDFIQCLVSLASKGTGFSQQWLLKDLEVLSLMLYTHEGCTTNVKKSLTSVSELPPKWKDASSNKEKNKELLNESDESLMSDSSSSTSSCETEINMVGGDIDDMFADVDEKSQHVFRILRSELNLPMTVLRAIYDMSDRNPDSVIKAIQENEDKLGFEGLRANPKEIVEKFSEKWEAITMKTDEKADTVPSKISEKVIDTGIHFHPRLTKTERVIEGASEEVAVDTQCLIQTPNNDVEDEIIKQRRTNSADLLKKELEKHGKTGTREYLSNVNMAMSVLYARQVLTSLLAHWPAYGHVISSHLLGCKEVQQIPCVLDLLNKTGSKENFQKVVQNLVQHCEQRNLIPIAQTACQFMEEVTMSFITFESEHNYKASNVKKQQIQMPGASYLSVTFDSKCSTREEEDELIFSTSKDMQQNNHTFSGSFRGSWNSFQVPGDTIYQEFLCESGKSDTHWGYKFTVTAGTRDSFETGYIILNDVLSSHHARCLPLADLWGILVYVASKQTGTQRLKTIQLLLKILHTQHKSDDCVELEVNLSLLKPLWQLYNNMTKHESEPTAILPPVSRALTELFLIVENLAIEWNIMQEYLVSMQDVADVKLAFLQGLQHIAAISVMIGHQNLATELVTAALKRKKTQLDEAAKSKPVAKSAEVKCLSQY